MKKSLVASDSRRVLLIAISFFRRQTTFVADVACRRLNSGKHTMKSSSGRCAGAPFKAIS